MITKEELQYYQRQLGIPSWGIDAQNRLKSARVFVAGAGGLGSPVLMYLAAAGVGTLTFCDDDRVDPSNLNRQIIHSRTRIGALKVDSVCHVLSELNPQVKLHPIKKKITSGTVENLLSDSAIIVDCLDNFKTRMVMNKISVKMRIPMVHGGVEGMRGQISFFNPPHTACLACIIPGKSIEKKVNIAGATAGVIGSLQALEAIKHITGIGEPLYNKILFWDGADMRFETVTVERNPKCPVCRQ